MKDPVLDNNNIFFKKKNNGYNECTIFLPFNN